MVVTVKVEEDQFYKLDQEGNLYRVLEIDWLQSVVGGEVKISHPEREIVLNLENYGVLSSGEVIELENMGLKFGTKLKLTIKVEKYNKKLSNFARQQIKNIIEVDKNVVEPKF